MKPLIIISAVVLFFALVLFSKVRIKAVSSPSLTIRAGLGPVLIKVYPRKKKRKKVRLGKFSQKKYLRMTEKLRADREREQKEAQEEEAKKKKEKEAKKGGSKSLSDKISEIKSLVEFVVRTAGKYSKKIIVDVRSFRVTVGGDDAAETAKKYGAAAQGVAYVSELLSSAVTFRAAPGSISADADFLAEKVTLDADVTVAVRLINIIRIGLAFLTRKSGGEEDKQ